MLTPAFAISQQHVPLHSTPQVDNNSLFQLGELGDLENLETLARLTHADAQVLEQRHCC